MLPDTSKLNSIVHTTIRTKISFYIKNAKITKLTKFDKTSILDHGLTLLDSTTQSISIFIRENIGFYRFYQFDLKVITLKNKRNIQPQPYIIIHNNSITEFRTLTRLIVVWKGRWIGSLSTKIFLFFLLTQNPLFLSFSLFLFFPFFSYL